ncbi:MAG: UDP-N-acetylglucosamine 2-epimerase (non-hydrolyzing) [Lentisphaerae bacterium]|nr:UDP-N-acetylglucosamine 2-epimerase (non-hydrolyzing) [Lentisphaerota bacterium]
MKIMTILGTRPEIVRLSRIIPKLDAVCDHVLVHTGQNHDRCLKDLFLDELGVRAPDHTLLAKGTFGQQVAAMFPAVEALLREERPDRLLILGDTNSGLAAVLAKRMGICVCHMEAGNRCYDDRVPEEVNRRIIDHSSDILMPYTERSRQNLLREGIAGQRIFVTGNPIKEVIDHYSDRIEASTILRTLNLEPRNYILVTMHRAENVDIEARLRSLSGGLERMHDVFRVPVIVSTHPRTRDRMKAFGVENGSSGVKFLDPFGFPDFLALERSAMCLISDSGTVQEEGCILGVPNVTIRDVTERPETLECGSNFLCGADPEILERGVKVAVSQQGKWMPPQEYLAENVSDTIVRLVAGFRM